MNLKDKIKTLAIGIGLGMTTSATVTSCSTDKNKEKEPITDMLSIDNINDFDMYNNPVTLHKVDVPIYKDNTSQNPEYRQLVWGLESNEKVRLERTRAGQKTHLEEYELPNGDNFWVETYDDGVLKANNSLIVIDKKIQVVGDPAHYKQNLERRAEQLEVAALLKKREKLEQIRAQERANMRRGNSTKTEAGNAQNFDIPADSMEVKKDTLQNNDVHKHNTDSLPIDTLRHKQLQERD